VIFTALETFGLATIFFLMKHITLPHQKPNKSAETLEQRTRKG